MTAHTNLFCLYIILPLAGAFLAALIGERSRKMLSLLVIITTLGEFLTALGLVSVVNHDGPLVYLTGVGKSFLGITMVLDGLSVFMAVIISFIAFLVAVYSVNYMERYTSVWKFDALFLFMVAGMNGVIMTADIFNLYVFLEIASLASIALIAFGVKRPQFEAAFKYAILSILGSFFVLLAIALLYKFTSTLNMAQMAVVFAYKGQTNIGLMISVLFMMGFGLKAALVPFHAWLPDAHPQAPAPVSAMLSGVLIKALGFYTLCRIFFNVIGVSPHILGVFMFLGVLSMLVGGILAVGQWDMKRLWACSSISNMGFIFFGIGLGTPLGILGAVFHVFNHALIKSQLFLNAGAVEYATGTRDLRELGGLSEKMPVTSATGFIAAMAGAGMPPFNGFWSKFMIIVAAIQAGQIGYAVCGLIASLFLLGAILKVIRLGFQGPLKAHLMGIKEVPILMRIPMEILALGCVLGVLLLFGPIRVHYLDPAVGVIMHGKNYMFLVLRHLI
ncbi:MAG: NADH/ubiquinone/plastoquinone (complex I) [Candidatus Omnitrophica bacterium]|nr:NADH/ubiquinone/plastoquinone (complex I) [Candidatus Omnitrophota bacterium]